MRLGTYYTIKNHNKGGSSVVHIVLCYSTDNFDIIIWVGREILIPMNLIDY